MDVNLIDSHDASRQIIQNLKPNIIRSPFQKLLPILYKN